MKPDREQLRAWYRQAMTRRASELRALRDGLAAAESAACDEARAIGQALRGSGATFGFADLSTVAALVESSPNAKIARRVEGLVEHLDRLSHAGGVGRKIYAEWLLRAAGVEREGPEPFSDLASAWRSASKRSGLSPGQVAERVARSLTLETADLTRHSRAALRLVPEALIRRELVLPIAEDLETIRVATADPTCLDTELELTRLTGREPVFSVAPPDALEEAMGVLLDAPRTEAVPRRRVVAPQPDGPERVLVVDDDGSSRLLARTVLEKRGYAVLEAVDGVEALDRLRASAPVALVVADLNMPEMDGLELLWEMRADQALSHIPVIVLTGATDEILETKLIEEGADDYVCKPLDPRLFLARVGATIRRAGG